MTLEEDSVDRGTRVVREQQSALPRPWAAIDRGVLMVTNVAVFVVGTLFTLLVAAEVVCRYLLGFSLFFVAPGARLLLIWFFLLGAGIALRHNAHVGFELLVSRLRGGSRRGMLTAGYGCALAFFAEMIWSGAYSIAPALPQTEAGLGISVVWFVLPVPVGFLLLAYHMVVLLALLWREPRPATASAPARAATVPSP
jgi:TRAP-type C4-dicarboxylate transport system permease small subunit